MVDTNNSYSLGESHSNLSLLNFESGNMPNGVKRENHVGLKRRTLHKKSFNFIFLVLIISSACAGIFTNAKRKQKEENAYSIPLATRKLWETSGILHIPNTYCRYYKSGGDGSCKDGRAFNDVWAECDEDGPDKCMGVMWNSCTGPTSDTSVNGAWKLMEAGQDIGDADNPTATCGGKQQALGHWDVYIREPSPSFPPSGILHIPNTYCRYYKSGGDGSCKDGRAFNDVWAECDEDGPDKCMGVMWNSCTGPTSDTSVNGAWKLMEAGQDIGDADNPTATCGGKQQALGHWDVYIRKPYNWILVPNGDIRVGPGSYYTDNQDITITEAEIFDKNEALHFVEKFNSFSPQNPIVMWMVDKYGLFGHRLLFLSQNLDANPDNAQGFVEATTNWLTQTGKTGVNVYYVPDTKWRMKQYGDIGIGVGSYYFSSPAVSLVMKNITTEKDGFEYTNYFNTMNPENPIIMWEIFGPYQFFRAHRLQFLSQYWVSRFWNSSKSFIDATISYLHTTGGKGWNVFYLNQ